jgi:sulfur-carrier protein
MNAMQIELRFFAGVREALCIAAETVAVPEGVTTLGELRAWLRERGGAWAETLAEGRVLRMACDHEMSDSSRSLRDGCEVAFFPPVTGG